MPDLQVFSEDLLKYLGKVEKVTKHLLSFAATNIEASLADATLYLEMFGIMTIAWQWLEQALVAQSKIETAHDEDKNFYQGKLMTTKYFFEYELVKIDSIAKRLQSASFPTIEMQKEWF